MQQQQQAKNTKRIKGEKIKTATKLQAAKLKLSQRNGVLAVLALLHIGQKLTASEIATENQLNNLSYIYSIACRAIETSKSAHQKRILMPLNRTRTRANVKCVLCSTFFSK